MPIRDDNDYGKVNMYFRYYIVNVNAFVNQLSLLSSSLLGKRLISIITTIGSQKNLHRFEGSVIHDVVSDGSFVVVSD